MDKIIAEFEELLAGPPGTQFIKANLHVHTPASKDWNRAANQTRKADEVSAGDIVLAARDAELDMIAITDHNTVKMCDEVIAAAKYLRKNDGYDLTVLPGVEISTHEAVHLQAIFDMNHPVEDLDTWIKHIGLQGKGDPADSTSDKFPLSEIMQMVHDMGGVVVAPHAKSRNGLLTHGKGSSKLEWLNSGLIDLIALREDQQWYSSEEDRFLPEGMSTRDVRVRLAFINVSDSSRLEDIGEGASWLAVGEKSVAGLRQLVCEPKTRISRVPPSDGRNDALLGLAVDGGYFDGVGLGFSDRFSAVIGGNHAGKSSVFDIIRFALGNLPADKKQRERHLKRLKGILQQGSTVRLYYRREDEYYVAVRVLDLEVDALRDRIVKIRSIPEVYRYVDGTLEMMREPPGLRVEIFEQGEVSRIREQTKKQLELLDRYAGHESDLTGYWSLVRELEENSKKLVPVFGKVQELEEEVGQLPELERKQAEVQAKLEEAVFQDEEKWNAEKEYFERVRELFRGKEQEVQQRLQAPKLATPLPDRKDVVDFGEISALGEVVNRYAERFREAARREADLVAEFRAELEGLFATANERHEKRKRRIADALLRLKVPSKENLVEQNEKLGIGIGKIKHTLMPMLDEQKKTFGWLSVEREKKLRRLRALREQIRRVREEKSRELGERLGEGIAVELHAYEERSHYMEALDRAYSAVSSQGSRIYRKEEQLRLVAENLAPWELAECIREGDEERILGAVEGITENTSRVLAQVGRVPEELHNIEVCNVEDKPVITVKRAGEGELVPLEDLSGGEQSAAILAIAMINSDIPLLIDQPEEELHYSSVTRNLVRVIVDTKPNRQLMLITLNPNIPVLGDAELIVSMRNDVDETWGRHCYGEVIGTFENEEVIEKLLEMEGGRKAFQRRHQRYTGESFV